MKEKKRKEKMVEISWRQSEKRERESERKRERLHDIIRKKVAVVPPDARATNNNRV